MEVAVDTLGAKLLGLGPGDQMQVFPAASFADPPSIAVNIVGTFHRTDPEDEFWFGAGRVFSFESDRWTIIPLFTTEEAVFQQVIGPYPGLYTDTTWFYYLDRQAVPAKKVDTLQSMILGAKADVLLNLRNSGTSIKLDQVLDDHQEQLMLARIPLFLIIFLVTGILVYYLALVAGLMVRARSTEIAMLKSPGCHHASGGVVVASGGTAAGGARGDPGPIAGPGRGSNSRESVFPAGRRWWLGFGPGGAFLPGVLVGFGRGSAGGGCVVSVGPCGPPATASWNSARWGPDHQERLLSTATTLTCCSWR